MIGDLPERIEITTDHIWNESVAIDLNESCITLFSIAYGQIKAFIWIWFERKVTFIVIIYEILFRFYWI